MTTTQPQLLDVERAEHLAEALHRAFETCDASPDDIADDVFCDLLPPLWRFQIHGRGALLAQLRAITPDGSSVVAGRVIPTATGFVTEHVHTQPTGDDVEVARRLLLCEVRDGRISDELVVHCNGGWDRALRERHAADAPMLRA